MLDVKHIYEIAQRNLADDSYFIVDVRCSPANEVEILLDRDSSVGIDACAALSRAVEGELEAITEDFALTVASAGIGQPLKTLRQYYKLLGKPVEVVLKDGIKLTAVLSDARQEGITLAYTEKVAVEGKKRKTEVEVVKEYSFDQIKSACEYLDFK